MLLAHIFANSMLSSRSFHLTHSSSDHVRLFARPSRPDHTKKRGGSWVTCCCWTVNTHVATMPILARLAQLWPSMPESNGSVFSLNCHPVVLTDNRAYDWVHWKSFAATQWLDSSRWLLQPAMRNCFLNICQDHILHSRIDIAKTILRFIRDMVLYRCSLSTVQRQSIEAFPL